VTIHLARVGKPERSYREGLVEDNGIRVKTFSIVPESIRIPLSEKFQNYGWIPRDQVIHSVTKYLFYYEFFGIVQYPDQTDHVLGYYCGIVTPLKRNEADYFLTDLILDLWISPDLEVIELDRDEFETAISQDLFPTNLEKDALGTLSRLKSEFEKGIFPLIYLS
jgi:predicted RNA-binding protein associated with RNAse of E/G family